MSRLGRNEIVTDAEPTTAAKYPALHKHIQVDGLNIFYREAGASDAPTILLLHGFPTSSHMYRNLIPALRRTGAWTTKFRPDGSVRTCTSV